MSDETIVKIVSFKLENEIYGIGILDIQEIIIMQAITTLPATPEFVEGVINLRGNVIPVIDLKKRFRLSDKTEVTPSTRIIITQITDKLVGFIVDEVMQVQNINKTDVQDADKVSIKLKNRFISGIGKFRNNLIIILNIKEILTEDEQQELQSID